MSGVKTFDFPSVEDFVTRFKEDGGFAESLNTAFETNFDEESLRKTLGDAYDNVDEAALSQLSVALDGPVNIGDIAVPSLGVRALMVAVLCKGTTLVVRYKMGSGGFFDMVRTPESTACGAEG